MGLRVEGKALFSLHCRNVLKAETQTAEQNISMKRKTADCMSV